MKLARLAIRNFRGIVDLAIDLDQTTVLIGENNTGKTSVLESLHTCLSRGLTRRASPFSEYDFHLADDSSQPAESPPIEITLTFQESAEDEWPAEIDQVFDRAVQILDDNRKQLTFHVREKRGALLFARCWLLVEGETEYTILPELAIILEKDFSRCGVCCVEFAQCGLKPLIKIAEDLGIEWHLLADGDPKGDEYVTAAKPFLDASPERERITRLSQLDIEHTFWHSGYSAVYESAAGLNQRGAMVKSAPGDAVYPSQVIRAAQRTTSKPHVAYEATRAVKTLGAAGVPLELKTTIEMAVQLAGRCA